MSLLGRQMQGCCSVLLNAIHLTGHVQEESHHVQSPLHLGGRFEAMRVLVRGDM